MLGLPLAVVGVGLAEAATRARFEGRLGFAMLGMAGVTFGVWVVGQAYRDEWLSRRLAATDAATGALQFSGTLAACSEGLCKALDRRLSALTHRARAFQVAAWLGALLLVGCFALVAMRPEAGAEDGEAALVLAVAALALALVATWRARAWLSRNAEMLHRARSLPSLLQAWQVDALAGETASLRLDLRHACQSPAFRSAFSPHSKALKTHHRSRWARVVWVTACGSPVALELEDLVKCKRGEVVKRRTRLRGLVAANQAVWAVERLPPQLLAGSLTAHARPGGSGAVVSLRCTVRDLAEVGEALRAVYDALPRRRPDEVSG